MKPSSDDGPAAAAPSATPARPAISKPPTVARASTGSSVRPVDPEPRRTTSTLRRNAASSSPVPGPQTSSGAAREQRRGERGGRGGVRDAHLADAEQADAVARQLVGDSAARGEPAARLAASHRRARQVAVPAPCRSRDAGDGRATPMSTTTTRRPGAPARDRRAAAREVEQHLRRHVLRVRADTLGGDAVVGGHDDDARAATARRRRAANRSERHGEVLQPAETAARLGLGVERLPGR